MEILCLDLLLRSESLFNLLYGTDVSGMWTVLIKGI